VPGGADWTGLVPYVSNLPTRIGWDDGKYISIYVIHLCRFDSICAFLFTSFLRERYIYLSLAKEIYLPIYLLTLTWRLIFYSYLIFREFNFHISIEPSPSPQSVEIETR
jgi:hypothetical protein